MIRLEQLRKSYGSGVPAVDGIDLRVEPGELLILLGTSGCGKTTTLKMINRLIEPTSGRVLVDGRDVTHSNPVELRRSIGYVFQGVGLFPHMTVGENIAVTPGLLRWPRQTITSRVDELLDLVQLPSAEYRSRLPDQLSGGQRQRVGLARALAVRPRIMLMDEPFGALDPLTRDAIQEEFARIHSHMGLTTVMVTHDMTEALLLADRIAIMSAGKIIHIATPHELLKLSEAGLDPLIAQLMETPMRHARRLEELATGGTSLKQSRTET